MKLSRLTVAVAASVLVAACGTLSHVSANGTADESQLVWPKVEDAKFASSVSASASDYKGSWPNLDNVSALELGMSKDQIAQLVGQPHFSEGFVDVREWDYVFNFKENGEHKVCQLKVLFDTKMTARSFFWKPQGCLGLRDQTSAAQN